jgi:heterodisulfide reductase subunit C
MNIGTLFRQEWTRRKVMVEGYIVPDTFRCVQCGVCTFNCPLGIDIRDHVWNRRSIKDSRCLTCGECLVRCPRGVLRVERSNLFNL